MRPTSLYATLVVASLCGTSLAYLKVPVSKQSHPPMVRRRQLVTRGSVMESLGNNLTAQSYMATVSVGTPKQDISLIIDTGSSDTWVLSTKADLCSDTKVQAQEGTGCQTPFNEDDSTSYNITHKGSFHITYGDGSGVDGDYFTDHLIIGDQEILSLQMGIAEATNITSGLLGIGYSSNEASLDIDDPDTPEDESFMYPNIIDALVAQKLIEINAYSLYLDDLDSSTGSIIFGGMDTDKFQGNLIQMPIVPRELENGTQSYAEFSVAMTGFSVSDSIAKNTTSLTEPGFKIPVLLDSGTSLTYLPSSLTEDIFKAINAYDDSKCDDARKCSGLVLVDCNIEDNNPGLTFDFKFGDQSTIRVPMSEMIIASGKLGGLDFTGSTKKIPFKDICVFGIMTGEDEPYILGDTFLRSAYVVYDLKNHIVALAQTNFDSNKSVMVDFKATQTSIPQISGVATLPPVTATATRKPSGKQTGATSTSTPNAGMMTVPAVDLSWLAVLGTSLAFAVAGGGAFML